MNTEQNYVGRGNYANPFESTAGSNPSAANIAAKTSLTADNRPTPDYEFIRVNENIYSAQTRLLEVVDDFAGEPGASGPIELINDLLYHWLTTPATDLSLTRDKDQLQKAFRIVSFLAELFEAATSIHYFIDTQNEKEVRYE